MNEFGFWQRWGLELDDRKFANAFLALGVLAALPPAAKQHTSGKNLQELVLAALKLSAEKSKPVSWRFPKRNQRAKIGNERTLLCELNPLQVANAWKDAAYKNAAPSLRIQILGYPAMEGITPWFRMFFEADPSVGAAHIVFDAGRVRPSLKWPLRFGYLPGNAAEKILQEACASWPSKELAGMVRIDRENANCDVLLYAGSSSQLLRILLEPPVPQKTHLFIVRGTFEDDLAVLGRRLSAIAAEGHASGFIFLNPSIDDEALSSAVNRLVENLSHNQPLDVAVSEAFAKIESMDPVIFLSRDLAGFRLEHILEKFRTRLKSLPKAARPQIDKDVFLRMGMPSGGVRRDPLPYLPVPALTAERTKKLATRCVLYKHESSVAMEMATMNRAIDRAESRGIDDKQQQRFLQKQTFIKKRGKLVKENQAFHRGVPTLIRVRIGPSDEEWGDLKEAFPEEKLPKDRDEWRLTVVLTEPNHLKSALRRYIKLPKAGPSTECEFRIQPGRRPIFEGRITVLHRGRILQTAVLKGLVVGDESHIPANAKIEFFEKSTVRAHIGDLEERRQFDLAFVLNHTTDGRPRLTAIASDYAWCSDLTECKKIAADINAALSDIAGSVADYSGGLDSDKNRTLLVRLANLGNALYWSIVEEQFKAPGNRPDIADKEYIQIVSTKSDAVVPFEFIYDYEAPVDNAKLCPSWKKALAGGSCRKDCKVDKIKHVCPLGFWGVRKVIERHDVTLEFAKNGKDFYLQCEEPTRDRGTLSVAGTAIVAASQNVKSRAFAPVLSACARWLGAAPHKAKDWEDWAVLVQKYNPHVLIALPHTDGDGIDATLEIGKKAIKSNQIREMHVRPEGMEGYPLVALLGCDTAGTALEYGSHVRWFRRKGAAVVIGTIATVFGGHAAHVAEIFIKGLKQDNARSERLGEVIRSIKQKALLEGMLMPLCIVAYGDADWKLSRKDKHA